MSDDHCDLLCLDLPRAEELRLPAPRRRRLRPRRQAAEVVARVPAHPGRRPLHRPAARSPRLPRRPERAPALQRGRGEGRRNPGADAVLRQHRQGPLHLVVLWLERGTRRDAGRALPTREPELTETGAGDARRRRARRALLPPLPRRHRPGRVPGQARPGS